MVRQASKQAFLSCPSVRLSVRLAISVSCLSYVLCCPWCGVGVGMVVGGVDSMDVEGFVENFLIIYFVTTVISHPILLWLRSRCCRRCCYCCVVAVRRVKMDDVV